MSTPAPKKYVRYETRNLPEELFDAVRVRAARTKRSMEWVVNEMIAIGLSRTDAEGATRWNRWVEFSRNRQWGRRTLVK